MTGTRHRTDHGAAGRREVPLCLGRNWSRPLIQINLHRLDRSHDLTIGSEIGTVILAGFSMNQRRVSCLAAIAAIALSCIGSARANEVLSFHFVTYASSLQSLDVGDREGHLLRLSRRSGIAIFPDGSVGASQFSATNDYVNGSGTYLAYCNITLADGSVLWFRVAGSTKIEETTTLFPEAPVIVLGGTGRFEGSSGDGTFKGELTPFAVGANLYADVVINVRK